MLTPLIINRSASAPAEVPDWVQLAPKGEFPVTVDDRTYLQVLDESAIAMLANSLQSAGGAGLLIDYDHFSLDPDRPSEAAGWIKELQARPDGLWGRIEWTDRGADAVRNRRYLYLSPTWGLADCRQITGNRIRPMRLKNAALTNAPNLIGIRPIVNRLPAQAQTAGDPPAQPIGGVHMDYKAKLLALLGLPEDADDEAIQTALASANPVVTNQEEPKEESKEENGNEDSELVKSLRERIKELEEKLLALQVDKDLEENKDVIENREAARAALLANRKGALAMLRALRPSKAHDPKFARTPQGIAANAKNIMNRQREIIGEIRNRDQCSFEMAFSRAQEEHPEVFNVSEE